MQIPVKSWPLCEVGGGWLLSPSLEMTPVPKVTVLSVDRSPVGCQVKGAEPGKVGKVGR